MRNTQVIRKTLICYNTTQCKLPNRPGELFYSLTLLWLVYLLYELPNKPDKLSLSGTFTICCTSYQIDQMGFYPPALLRLVAQAIKQAKRASFGTFTTSLIAKHQIGQTNSSTLWHLTALPFAISLDWVVTMDYTPPRSWTAFDLYTSLVWSTDIIATLVSRQLGDEVP